MRKRIIRNGVKRAVAFVAALSLVVTSNGFGMTGGGYADAEELKQEITDTDDVYEKSNKSRVSVHDPPL